MDTFPDLEIRLWHTKQASKAPTHGINFFQVVLFSEATRTKQQLSLFLLLLLSSNRAR